MTGSQAVKWASSKTGFKISIQTPNRTKGTVALPPGPARYSLTVNGQSIPVSPGQTLITVR
jgi:hypothetical protein